MIKVYDDIIYSLQKSGGGSVYWTNIICRNKENSTHLIFDNACGNICYNNINVPNAIFSSSILLSIKRYFDVRVSLNEKFIFHSSLYRICSNKNAINITTVHDFTYEYYRKDIKSILHKLQKKRSVLKSQGVICISENTKKDFQFFYPSYNGLLKVIPNGYDTAKFFFKNCSLRDNIVLFIGARTNYKRFDIAIEIVTYLSGYVLYVIGGGALTKEEERLLRLKLPNKFKKLSYISDDELCDLYNRAFCLCYPSEYEGFGIPVIEAQACGCPVICQKKSSIPEVAGNAALYINPNLDNYLFEINKLFDKVFYSQLQEKGLINVQNYSWDHCVNQVKDFYEEVFSK